MKKPILIISLLTLSLCFNSVAYGAEKAASENNAKKAPITKNLPKLYDKQGNELKAPPKPGEAVYDKNGNILPPPPFCKQGMLKGPDLQLTDKQKEKADKIREASKTKIKPIRRQIHDLKNEIWEIKEDDSLTPEEQKAKIEPLFEKMKALREQANKIRQEDMAQFETILTKEQKKTLEEFKKNHKPGMECRPCPIKPHHFEE